MNETDANYRECCPVCKGFEDQRRMVPVPDDGFWHGRCFVGARGLDALLNYPSATLGALRMDELLPDQTRAVLREIELRSAPRYSRAA